MLEKIQINSNAINLRKKLKEDPYSPIDIFSLVNSLDNLTIVFYPMSSRISGMCMKVDNDNIVAINSNSTYGRQRFTMAHELCHLYFHEDIKNSICLQEVNNNQDREEEADIFASYFLAPHEALQNFIIETLNKTKDTLNIDDVVKIEQHFGFSRKAILKRLILDGYIDESKTLTMKYNIIKSASKLGYDSILYRPNPENKKYLTIGNYIKIAENLNELEAISNSKYEELLLDAYRADIVFGLDEEEEMYD